MFVGRWGVVAIGVAGTFAFVSCSTFDGEDSSDDLPDGGDAAIEPVDGSSLTDALADADGGPVPCTTTPPAAEVIPTGGGPATLLANDGSYLYWVSGAAIRRRALDGASESETVYAGTIPVSAFAVISGWVVFATDSTYYVPSNRAADAGPTTLSGPVRAVSSHEGVIVGHNVPYVHRFVPPTVAATAFVATTDSAPVSDTSANASNIFYVSTAGDAGPGRAVFAVVNSAALYQTPTRIFYAAGRDPARIAVDGQDLFMLDALGEAVVKVPITGGAETVLATGLPNLGLGLGRIVVRSNQVYFSTPDAVRRVAKAGGCTTTLATGALSDFTVTADHLYFSKADAIARVPR